MSVSIILSKTKRSVTGYFSFILSIFLVEEVSSIRSKQIDISFFIYFSYRIFPLIGYELFMALISLQDVSLGFGRPHSS